MRTIDPENQTTWQHAFCTVIFETSKMKNPMISNEIGTGSLFINLLEEARFVVQTKAPKSLASAMLRLLSDETLTNKMGLADRNCHEQLFSVPALEQAYVSIYKELL
ncbi:MAG: hypothetical protein V9E92_02335 [Methylotenera sp.]